MPSSNSKPKRLAFAAGLLASTAAWFLAVMVGWVVGYKAGIVGGTPRVWFLVLTVCPFVSMVFAYLLIRSRREVSRSFIIEDLFVVLVALAPWIFVVIARVLQCYGFYFY